MSTTNHRRERGYNFEKAIVDRFNDRERSSWTARRLGGSSVGLPDVVATNGGKKMMFSMECKSTISDTCYVPDDQILRCYEVVRMFDMYPFRYIVLAFKFAKPKVVKGKNKNNRKLQYWYFIVDDHDNIANISSIKCTRNGTMTWNLYNDKLKTFFLTRRFETLDEIMELEVVAPGKLMSYYTTNRT